MAALQNKTNMADLVKTLITSLATSPDTQTTALGSVAGTLVLANIDYAKLFAGDHTEISKALGALGLFLFGYLTNKRKKTPPPTQPAPPAPQAEPEKK